jgi:hypothetical protein
MAKNPQPPQESLQLVLDAVTFKELLRDLLFREAGKPYFKSFHIPRRRWCRLLGTWRTLPTYQAERQLLPVGVRNSDQRIQEFFTTYVRLRTEFQEGGMPVTAIRVLQQRCPALNAALAYVHWLECTPDDQEQYYQVQLAGGAAPPPVRRQRKCEAGC